MNVRCVCGSGQPGERFSDRQQITAEGEDANSCCWTSSRGDLIGSQQDGAVDSIGVGGDDWGESKGKGKEDGPGEDDTFEQRVLLPRWGGNRLDGIEYGQLPRSQNRLTKGSCAIEENHSFFKRALKRLIGRDSSGCIAEHGKQFPEIKPSSCGRRDLAVTS